MSKVYHLIADNLNQNSINKTLKQSENLNEKQKENKEKTKENKKDSKNKSSWKTAGWWLLGITSCGTICVLIYNNLPSWKLSLTTDTNTNTNKATEQPINSINKATLSQDNIFDNVYELDEKSIKQVRGAHHCTGVTVKMRGDVYFQCKNMAWIIDNNIYTIWDDKCQVMIDTDNIDELKQKLYDDIYRNTPTTFKFSKHNITTNYSYKGIKISELIKTIIYHKLEEKYNNLLQQQKQMERELNRERETETKLKQEHNIVSTFLYDQNLLHDISKYISTLNYHAKSYDVLQYCQNTLQPIIDECKTQSITNTTKTNFQNYIDKLNEYYNIISLQLDENQKHGGNLGIQVHYLTENNKLTQTKSNVKNIIKTLNYLNTDYEPKRELYIKYFNDEIQKNTALIQQLTKNIKTTQDEIKATKAQLQLIGAEININQNTSSR